MTIAGFRYLHDLVLRRRREGNGRLFYVDAPYRVAFYLDDKPESVTVPAGFPTDLASIPRFVPRFIVEKVDRHIEAAVVHDLLCVTQMWTSRVAAEIFLAAMIAANVSVFDRNLMYRAVRYFGPRWGGS